MTHTIHVPVVVPKQLLTSNQRLHWALKATRTRYWRDLAFIHSKASRPVLLAKARVTVTFTWPDKRDRDPGNWAPTAKALVDGLTDAGWWPDDNSRHLIGPDLRRDPVPGPHAIRIDIEELT